MGQNLSAATPLFMSPPEQYQTFSSRFISHIKTSGLQPDPAQTDLAEAMDPVYLSITSPRQTDTNKGLYIWGPVGRGKTFLMDLLFEHLPKNALRLHFHRFMSHVHQRMTALQGQEDPLSLIAKELSDQYRLICFDEFFVNDIADAMILGRLLERLFKYDVLLVSTSNRPPEQLCKDPLFQDRMQPMIKLIQQQMRVHHIDGQTDHRFRQLTVQQNYYLTALHTDHCPLDIHYNDLCQTPATASHIDILNRKVAVKGVSESCIWFNFTDLCQGARSQLDYIELANRYSHILLSDVPPMGSKAGEQIKARGTEDGSVAVKAGERQIILGRMDDSARRFISLIDELYDRNVNLYMTTLVPIDQLYTEGSLMFEFDRTYSRLTEMQSLEYQQQRHLSCG